MSLHVHRFAPLALALCLLGWLGRGHADPLPIVQNDTILLYQICLVALGYDPGPTDGQMGPKTQAAWIQALKDKAAVNGLDFTQKFSLTMMLFLKSCGLKLLDIIVDQQSQLEQLLATTPLPPNPVKPFPVDQTPPKSVTPRLPDPLRR